MADKNPWKVATLVLAALLLISFFVPKQLLRPWENNANDAVPSAAAPSPPGPIITDPTVTVAVVNDPDCALCDASNVEVGLRTYFPTIDIKQVDASSAAGAKLIKRFDLQTLPSFIFDTTITKTANYDKVKDGLIEKDGGVYLLNPAHTGAGRLIHIPNILPDDAAQGSSNAPILMIEFSDFQCPFCKRFVDETYPQIKKNYIDTGKVRFIFRHVPLDFHEFAAQAALAAECADDQEKFWEYHDVLFKNQNALDVDHLKKYAAELNLDAKKFDDCVNSAKHAKRVATDMTYAASVGISGTPTFIINGFVVSGAQPYDVFKAVLDAELRK